VKNPWAGIVEGWRKGKSRLAAQTVLDRDGEKLTFRGIPVIWDGCKVTVIGHPVQLPK
jgi:hypothetical protein